VLDPAFAPGTGTPVSGGLTSRQLIELIKGILADLPVKAMDIVEDYRETWAADSATNGTRGLAAPEDVSDSSATTTGQTDKQGPGTSSTGSSDSGKKTTD